MGYRNALPRSFAAASRVPNGVSFHRTSFVFRIDVVSGPVPDANEERSTIPTIIRGAWRWLIPSFTLYSSRNLRLRRYR